MPSHIKSSLLGVSLMLPVHNGRLLLGVAGDLAGRTSHSRWFA
jgi:thiamine phosphate synthase YjbQ (UPF0047 family)